MPGNTKWPWVARRSPFEVFNVDHGLLEYEICAGTTLIAALYENDRSYNARLIAAAPELLEALEELVSKVEGHELQLYPEIGQEIITQARMAIKKAKGE